MNARSLFLPTLCLAGSALLLLPARHSLAFSRLGSNLSVNERDVRLFNSFADPTANANTTPSSQFPARLGAELSIWKAIVEWGSQAHGDGSGDPTQALLGNGGANFDAFWAGTTGSPGGTTNNVVSRINSCSSGVLAYCEAPFQEGWRIRFCESWVWSDGPGAISSGQFDLQGVMTHEYGHALGLGHSTVNGATMWPSVGSGSTSTRSIEADDIAGVKDIYGVRSGAKPTITATVASAGTLTIHGTNFSASGNSVWFSHAADTSPTLDDPRLQVTGVSSSGVRLTVAIPAGAGPGDVIVRNATPGHASVSNAFPTDLVGTFGTPPPATTPSLTAIVPDTIESLVPGTARALTLEGTELTSVEDVLLDGLPLAAGTWFVEDDTHLTIDPPQTSLGRHELAVVQGTPVATIEFDVVLPASPRLELASGDAGVIVPRSGGLRVRLAGTPGSQLALVVSRSSVPSTSPLVTLGLGDGFRQITLAGQFTIPPQSWLEIQVSSLPDPGPTGQVWFAQALELGSIGPLPVSNLQSIQVVR